MAVMIESVLSESGYTDLSHVLVITFEWEQEIGNTTRS